MELLSRRESEDRKLWPAFLRAIQKYQ